MRRIAAFANGTDGEPMVEAVYDADGRSFAGLERLGDRACAAWAGAARADGRHRWRGRVDGVEGRTRLPRLQTPPSQGSQLLSNTGAFGGNDTSAAGEEPLGQCA